ncbi:uncharacterized protein K460DRAFT_416424 [Cucurbitaria berberidis CBS 394.84]|uniref:Uncharacterized protein n=1 Tax=Cucurbitaria berberidis CBS 394.84 TaxID=1168544 RepID=A0A9P4GH28_9PLEO|nr:uncharacterized protein K460DRAFT_416424 [Cucurbitaria berberidis CBS 394.84]KAF1845109.1 hypothetical protein K460DRAFT_416424 [Cucurbitaria berberidis CBS 394.84]
MADAPEAGEPHARMNQPIDVGTLQLGDNNINNGNIGHNLAINGSISNTIHNHYYACGLNHPGCIGREASPAGPRESTDAESPLKHVDAGQHACDSTCRFAFEAQTLRYLDTLPLGLHPLLKDIYDPLRFGYLRKTEAENDGTENPPPSNSTLLNYIWGMEMVFDLKKPMIDLHWSELTRVLMKEEPNLDEDDRRSKYWRLLSIRYLLFESFLARRYAATAIGLKPKPDQYPSLVENLFSTLIRPLPIVINSDGNAQDPLDATFTRRFVDALDLLDLFDYTEVRLRYRNGFERASGGQMGVPSAPLVPPAAS